MLSQSEDNGLPLLEMQAFSHQARSTLQVHDRKATAKGQQSVEAKLSLVRSMYNESAVDADALGFMAKMLVQTTLPHRAQLGNHYTRTDGKVTLSITDLAGVGLPYGAYPRLILIWMTTEALRTGQRKLELGSSLSSFMEQLGLHCTGGHWGTIPRFRSQMERLFGAAISTRWNQLKDSQILVGGSNLLLAEDFNLWWTPQKLPRTIPERSSVTLSQRFFEQLVEAPVPLDLRAIKALKRSPLSLDLYAWATRRVSYLRRPLSLTWASFQSSLGADYAQTPQGRSRFRGNAIEALQRVKVVYPQLRVDVSQSGVLLHPSLTHVPKTSV
jgi:Plasmid encoded RepA protein